MGKSLLPWLAATMLLTSLNLSAQQFTFITKQCVFFGDKSTGIITSATWDPEFGYGNIIRPASYALEQFLNPNPHTQYLTEFHRLTTEDLYKISESFDAISERIAGSQEKYISDLDSIQQKTSEAISQLETFGSQLNDMRNKSGIAQFNRPILNFQDYKIEKIKQSSDTVIDYDHTLDYLLRTIEDISRQFPTLRKEIDLLSDEYIKNQELANKYLSGLNDNADKFMQSFNKHSNDVQDALNKTSISKDSLNMLINETLRLKDTGKYAIIEEIKSSRSAYKSSADMSSSISTKIDETKMILADVPEQFAMLQESFERNIKSLTDTCWKNIEANDMTWEIPSRIHFGSDSIKIRAIEGKFIFNQYATEESGECQRLKLIIPDSIEYIADRAFSGIEATEVTLNCPIPPNADEAIFNSWTYANAKLIVPDGSVETYRNTYPWSKFGTILVPSESSISDIIADGITIRIENGSVIIDSQAEVLTRIHNIAGQLLYEGYDRHIDLPAHGIYIVNAAGKTSKVAI